MLLVGRLTRDVELRYTPSNQAVATFTLAVNRNFKNQNGEREADFINVVIWRQQAENLANWAKKGALIGVTGRIQTRSYDNQQGQRVYVTEVVAESFQLLESRTAREGQGAVIQLVIPLLVAMIITRLIKRLRNLHRTSLEKKVHLEQTIQWIYQTTYHSRSETNNIKENTHGSTTSWRFQTP
jgi:hypothetical protein